MLYFRCQYLPYIIASVKIISIMASKPKGRLGTMSISRDGVVTLYNANISIANVYRAQMDLLKVFAISIPRGQVKQTLCTKPDTAKEKLRKAYFMN